jgi:hypothetical protein
MPLQKFIHYVSDHQAQPVKLASPRLEITN